MQGIWICTTCYFRLRIDLHAPYLGACCLLKNRIVLSFSKMRTRATPPIHARRQQQQFRIAG
eukprot:scaffold4964_cov96-Skeletonema_marinoi.AAC.3